MLSEKVRKSDAGQIDIGGWVTGLAALVAVAHVATFLVLRHYGIGLDTLPSSWLQLVSRATLTGTGLVLLTLVPGVLYAPLLLPAASRSVPHLAVVGLALNLIIYSALFIVLGRIGVAAIAESFLAAIALLTAAGGILLRRSMPALEIPRAHLAGTALAFGLSLACLLIVVAALPRPIFTRLDRTHTEEALATLTGDLAFPAGADAVRIEHGDADWIRRNDGFLVPRTSQPRIVLVNPGREPRPFVVRLLTSYAADAVEVSLQGSPPSRLPLTAHAIDPTFSHTERILSTGIMALEPGRHVLEVRVGRDFEDGHVLDLSGLDQDGLARALRTIFFVAYDPEVGDAYEAVGLGRDSLTVLSLVNPPLIYLFYGASFHVLGESIVSVHVLELFAFLIVFMLVWAIAAGDGAPAPARATLAVFGVQVVYLAAIVSLPVIHTSAGVFLAMFLAGAWFTWRGLLVPGVLCLALVSLLRWEGALLAAMTLAACWVMSEHRRTTVRTLAVYAALMAVAAGIVLAIRGPELLSLGFMQERFGAMTATGDGGTDWFRRPPSYAFWVIVMGCGLPLLALSRGRDRAATYYLALAAAYFVFLCTLSMTRPYHLGPVVLAATIAGGRSLARIGTDRPRLAALVPVLLTCGALWIVLDYLPRNVASQTFRDELAR